MIFKEFTPSFLILVFFCIGCDGGIQESFTDEFEQAKSELIGKYGLVELEINPEGEKSVFYPLSDVIIFLDLYDNNSWELFVYTFDNKANEFFRMDNGERHPIGDLYDIKNLEGDHWEADTKTISLVRWSYTEPWGVFLWTLSGETLKMSETAKTSEGSPRIFTWIKL